MHVFVHVWTGGGMVGDIRYEPLYTRNYKYSYILIHTYLHALTYIHKQHIK